MALKGIGYKSDTVENIRRINSVNPKWWYNWNQYRVLATPDTIPAEFVPMLYSNTNSGTRPRLDNFAADMAALKAEVPKTVTAILGPNEPDMAKVVNGVTQYTLTPLEVLNVWNYIQDNGFGLLKGSPATVSTVRTWNDQFLGARAALDQGKQSWERDFEVNFVATHIYMNPVASEWLKKVDAMHDKFGKDIWVTETCVHDFGAKTMAENEYSRAQVEDFMRGIWEGSKSRSWLKRIAWHTREWNDPEGWSGSLFNADGSLTSTGIVWRDLDAA